MSQDEYAASAAKVAGAHRVIHKLESGRHFVIDKTAAFQAPREMDVVVGGAFELTHSGKTFNDRPRLAYMSFCFAKDDTNNPYTAADLDIFGERHSRETGAVPGFSFHVAKGQKIYFGFLIETYAEEITAASLVVNFTYIGI